MVGATWHGLNHVLLLPTIPFSRVSSPPPNPFLSPNPAQPPGTTPSSASAPSAPPCVSQPDATLGSTPVTSPRISTPFGNSAQIFTPCLCSTLPSPTSSSHGPTSSSQSLEPRSDWPRGQKPELEAIPFAAPVTNNSSGTHPKWEPISYQNKKEFCRAQKDFGRKGEFLKG